MELFVLVVNLEEFVENMINRIFFEESLSKYVQKYNISYRIRDNYRLWQSVDRSKCYDFKDEKEYYISYNKSNYDFLTELLNLYGNLYGKKRISVEEKQIIIEF